MRVPLYEAVPIELVMSQCWVMDLNTYCKVINLLWQYRY